MGVDGGQIIHVEAVRVRAGCADDVNDHGEEKRRKGTPLSHPCTGAEGVTIGGVMSPVMLSMMSASIRVGTHHRSSSLRIRPWATQEKAFETSSRPTSPCLPGRARRDTLEDLQRPVCRAPTRAAELERG